MEGLWNSIRPLSLPSCLVIIAYSFTRNEKPRKRKKNKKKQNTLLFCQHLKTWGYPWRLGKREKWMPSNSKLLLRILKSRLSWTATVPSHRKVHFNENNRIWGQVRKALSCRSTARYSHSSSLERSQPSKLCFSSKNCTPSGTESRNQVFFHLIFSSSPFSLFWGKKNEYFPPWCVKHDMWKRAYCLQASLGGQEGLPMPVCSQEQE